ncbi:pyridoxamine 5'-phosphate oxidase [Synechocystis sp. LKSZ1]|uniref:pyridoxamine 5'-phosphate oxidase n=1 Tax=Synechocystis sp. LKSZ1 TaxID=3144951 RepID=UPI00336BD272
MDLSALRRDYSKTGLTRSSLQSDPFDQFEQWFQQATQANLLEPNGMILATVDAQGMPMQRTVLLKYFDRQGFVFFTNYESRKAQHIHHNPQVCLLFPWWALERQVIITGIAIPVSTGESLTYFLSRPRGSQLGAWCSQQSQVISSRQLLEVQFEKMREKFAQGEVPLPPFWGGYRVIPQSFEFWQGRSNRLHDRFLYRAAASGSSPWTIDRLSP